MPERLTPISKARADLPQLSRAAQKRLDRYVITHQGQPQSVLIGYEEYQSLKAAVELLHRPEVVEDIKAGLKELKGGRRLTSAEMKKRVRETLHSGEASKLATELADKSGVDCRTVETVMSGFEEKVKADLSRDGRFHVPGVGEFVIDAVESKLPRNDARSVETTGTDSEFAGPVFLLRLRNKQLTLKPAEGMKKLIAKETKKAI